MSQTPWIIKNWAIDIQALSQRTLNNNIIYTYIHINIFRALSRRFYPKRLKIGLGLEKKYICQKKVEQYIADGTVRMFIEISAKHLQLLG